jgi:hypothetical protein
MRSRSSAQGYGAWYARLLRFYPKRFRERFAEGMQQTFNDLCRERAAQRRSRFAFALSVFAETSAGIMKENGSMLVAGNKNTIRIVLAAATLLLIPLVAMSFTGEVEWTAFDFIVAFVLLSAPAVAFEVITRMTGNFAYRAATGLALATAFFLIWANLAVGVIGTEEDSANLMYAGVLAVAIVGAVIARGNARGMALALFATALSHVVVAGIALLAGKHDQPEMSIAEVVLVNGFFGALWTASALLFLRAATTNNDSIAR